MKSSFPISPASAIFPPTGPSKITRLLAAPALVAQLLIAPALFTVTGCGGGGGGGDGDDFLGAALVEVAASPRNIDTGDRTAIRAFLSEVNDDGLMLKFRFPKELRYVLDSASLVIDEDDRDISPRVKITVDNDNFLVFFIAQDDFDDDARGIVEFQLEADDTVSEGEVEVDPDVDDPLIDNDSEFDPENPEFGAEASVSISVRD